MRVMPNTPCLVGETASAMCLGGTANEEDAEEVRTLFSSVGRIVQVGHTPLCSMLAHAPLASVYQLRATSSMDLT